MQKLFADYLVLSKYPFSSTGAYYLPGQRSIAQVRITVNSRTIDFFATHLEHMNPDLRRDQVRELITWTARPEFSQTRIVVGDFNTWPDDEVIRDEKMWMGRDYFDSWRVAMDAGTATAYPDNPVDWNTRTRRNRIDYIFYSKGASNLVLESAQIPDIRQGPLMCPNPAVCVCFCDGEEICPGDPCCCLDPTCCNERYPEDKGVRPSDHNQVIATFRVR